MLFRELRLIVVDFIKELKLVKMIFKLFLVLLFILLFFNKVVIMRCLLKKEFFKVILNFCKLDKCIKIFLCVGMEVFLKMMFLRNRFVCLLIYFRYFIFFLKYILKILVRILNLFLNFLGLVKIFFWIELKIFKVL